LQSTLGEEAGTFKRPLTVWNTLLYWRGYLKWALMASFARDCLSNNVLWGSLWYIRVDGKSSEKFVVERGWGRPLTIFVPGGDGSTVEAYSSTISTWGASFILTTSTHGYKHRVSPGSGNFSEEFAAKHFPKLAKSWQKWSGSLARGHQASALVCEVEGSLLPVGNMGKCLGVWRKGNLWCGQISTAENIKKAREPSFS